MRLPAISTSTSPSAMKYIEWAVSPRRTITSPAFDRLRPQQPHDVGDGDGVEPVEQRHPRHHAPGHHEIAAVDLSAERGGNDADRQRDHHNAAQDGRRRDQLAGGVTGTTSP